MQKIIHSFFIFTAFFGLAGVVHAEQIPVFDWVNAYVSTEVNTGGSKGVAIDPNDGSIIIGNRFTGTADLDPGSGTDSFVSAGGNDAFITKFDSDGTYEWSQAWGGSGAELANYIAISDDGTIVAGGTFASTADFDPTGSTNNKTAAGSNDPYVSFFDSDGTYQSTLTWGGTGDDSVGSIVVDGDYFYVPGLFNDTVDFDPSGGTSLATSTGSYDVYLSKFALDGTYQWTKTWGGTGFDSIGGLVVADNGDIVFNGFFSNTIDLDPGAGTSSSTSSGGLDAYLIHLDSSGTYEWGYGWGGTSTDLNAAAAVDSDGSVYSFGYFSSTVDFDPTGGTDSLVSNGGTDFVLSKFSSDGAYEWARAWGGSGSETAYVLVLDGEENPIALGRFPGTVDFDPTSGTDTRVSAGSNDLSMTRLDSDGNYLGTEIISGAAGDEWLDRGAVSNASGEEKLVIVGVYKSTPTDFDPSGGTQNKTSDGDDIYLASFDLVAPDIIITPQDGELDEGKSDILTYTIALATPPTGDVTVTITPDAQVSVSTSSVTIASTTWSAVQTITVSVVNDEVEEAHAHSGVITNTITSSDTDYDDFPADSVTFSVIDNDEVETHSSSGRGSSGGSQNEDDSDGDEPFTTDSILVPSGNPAELLQALNQKLHELKQQLVILLLGKVKELQAELAKLSN